MSVIVAGAGPGIGLAAARRLSRDGYPAGLIARDAERLEALADTLRASGVRVATAAANLADPGAVVAALGQLTADIGDVQIAVYNASVLLEATPTELRSEDLAGTLAVDVIGAHAFLRAAAASMRKRGGGTIIVTGGGLALYPSANFASLSIGKAAVRNLALAAAEELAPSNIHVATVTILGTVAPGTPFDPDRIADVYAELAAEPRERWRTEVQYDGRR